MRSPSQVFMAICLAGLSVCVAAGVAGAQTIRPLSAEFRDQASGKVELVNESDRPVMVTVQPRGFVVNERGEMIDRPLPSSIHVRLSAMSVQIPPRQSRFVFYEVTADAAPAWLVLYASFSAPITRGNSTLNAQIELPHMIYVLPRTQLAASAMSMRLIRQDGPERKLAVEIENRSADFGRVVQLDVKGDRGTNRVGGFAMFPHSRRLVDVPWTDAPAVAVSLRTAGFTLDRTLSASHR